jgi:hypothetical protein
MPQMRRTNLAILYLGLLIIIAGLLPIQYNP